MRWTLGVLLGAACFAHTAAPAAAEQDPTPDTIAVAEEAAVDPIALQGAVNTTGLSARDYLVATGELQPALQVAAAAPWGLSPYLQRVARCESGNFAPAVVYGPARGAAGEIGLFQLHPRGLLPLFYARGYANPWDPQQQAEFATWAFGAGLARHWSCR